MHDETSAVEMPPRPRDKAELLDRIHQARAALEQMVGALSEAQLTARGSDGWAVKDHLIHIAVWEQSLIALLTGRPRHTAMGLDEASYLGVETDEVNAILYQRDKDRPLPEARAIFHATHQQLLTTLAGLSDADLFKTYAQYLPDEPGEDDGRPVLVWIIGNTYEHYEEHQIWSQALLAANQQ